MNSTCTRGTAAALAVALSAMMLGSGCERLFTPHLDQATFEKGVAEASKQLPMTIDADTRWDSMKALPNLTFEYNYTLLHYRGKEVDPAPLKAYFPTIAARACSSPEFKRLIDLGASARYYYRGNDGVAVAAFQLMPKGCTSPPAITVLPFG